MSQQIKLLLKLSGKYSKMMWNIYDPTGIGKARFDYCQRKHNLCGDLLEDLGRKRRGK